MTYSDGDYRYVRPIERVPWATHREFLADAWDIDDTPHISIIAPTGGGKTYLASRGIFPLIEDEPLLVLDVKDDSTSPHMPDKPDFQRVRKLPHRITRRNHEKRKSWFRLVVETREQALDAMMTARSEGGWNIYLDETRALTDRHPMYNLAAEIDGNLWLRGRGRVCVIAATQAPRFVPASFYEQPSHVYIGPIQDRRARRRLEEIGGDTDAILRVVSSLHRYEWLYIGPLAENGRRVSHITKVE